MAVGLLGAGVTTKLSKRNTLSCVLKPARPQNRIRSDAAEAPDDDHPEVTDAEAIPPVYSQGTAVTTEDAESIAFNNLELGYYLILSTYPEYTKRNRVNQPAIKERIFCPAFAKQAMI